MALWEFFLLILTGVGQWTFKVWLYTVNGFVGGVVSRSKLTLGYLNSIALAQWYAYVRRIFNRVKCFFLISGGESVGIATMLRFHLICIFVICRVILYSKVLTHYVNHLPSALFRVGRVGSRRGWKKQQCAGDGCQPQELCRKTQSS